MSHISIINWSAPITIIEPVTFSFLSQTYKFTFLFFLCFLCCWPIIGFQLACALWSVIWQDLEEYFVVREFFSISCSDWLTKLTGLVMEQLANSVFLSRVFSNAAIRAWEAKGGCIPDTLLSDCLKKLWKRQFITIVHP